MFNFFYLYKSRNSRHTCHYRNARPLVSCGIRDGYDSIFNDWARIKKPESEVVRHLKDPVSAPVEYEAGPWDTALRAIACTGPRPWVFVLGIYLGHGGRPKSFSKRLYRYQKRWPDRIVIRRGYDLSAGAFIEVDSPKTDSRYLVKN